MAVSIGAPLGATGADLSGADLSEGEGVIIW
jgi:hypothetical protein